MDYNLYYYINNSILNNVSYEYYCIFLNTIQEYGADAGLVWLKGA